MVAAGSSMQQAHVLPARICSARTDAGLYAVLLGGGLVPVCGRPESWNRRLSTVCQTVGSVVRWPVCCLDSDLESLVVVIQIRSACLVV